MAFAVFLVLLVPPVLVSSQVFAAGLSAKESDDLRQAKTFYKSGSYQEAADIFARLSAAHPDIPTFGRNAGAAYYYLKKPDPALSNLREYLRVQKNLTDDDRQEVQRWISEMEQLRAQAPIPSSGRRQQPVAGPAAPPTVDSFGRPLPAQTQPVAGPAAPPTVDSFGRPLPAQTQPVAGPAAPPTVDSFGRPLPAQTQPVAGPAAPPTVDSFGRPLPAQTQPMAGPAAPPAVDSFGRPLPAQTQPMAGPAAPPAVDSFGRPLPAQTQPAAGPAAPPAVDSFGRPLPAQTQPMAGPAAPPTVDSFGRPLPAQTQPMAGPAAPPAVDSFGRPLPAQTQPPAVDSFGQPLPAQTQPVAVDSFGQPLPAQTQPVPGQAPSWSAPGPGQQPVQPGVAEENHPTEQPKSLAPWIIGGAGVACLGLGGLFTYLSQSAFSDTRAQYNPDRESAGRTYSGLQFVGYGLGAAGIVTAIVMLSLERSSTPGRVSLVPAVGPQLAGAQLHVSY